VHKVRPMSIWQTIVGRAASTLRSGSLSGLLGGQAPGSQDGGGPQLGVAFTIAIVALSAKMAKSDGFVTADEIEAFRRVCQFPASETENVRRVFDLATQDVAGYDAYARQVGSMLAQWPELRRNVLEGLFVIAAADGVLHEHEDRYLHAVSSLMDIPETEFAWVRSLFVADAMDPYTVLGLEPSAADADIKTRYRALVLEHHPDRLMGRGVPQDFVVIAERKLASITAAYAAIARERGL
jgi:DnaJ like chaperone protein